MKRSNTKSLMTRIRNWFTPKKKTSSCSEQKRKEYSKQQKKGYWAEQKRLKKKVLIYEKQERTHVQGFLKDGSYIENDWPINSYFLVERKNAIYDAEGSLDREATIENASCKFVDHYVGEGEKIANRIENDPEMEPDLVVAKQNYHFRRKEGFTFVRDDLVTLTIRSLAFDTDVLIHMNPQTGEVQMPLLEETWIEVIKRQAAALEDEVIESVQCGDDASQLIDEHSVYQLNQLPTYAELLSPEAAASIQREAEERLILQEKVLSDGWYSD